MIDHEQTIGADLLADSLSELVVNGRGREQRSRRGNEPPAVAYVSQASVPSLEAVAHPELEVLCIGVWQGTPLSLAPVAGLPRLRTLTAYPGTLADPLEITGLTGLEFLELAPEEWRVLLDADAVPRSLSAAAILVHGTRHPLPIVSLANELLALWDRPPITRTTLQADLRPGAVAGGRRSGRAVSARPFRARLRSGLPAVPASTVTGPNAMPSGNSDRRWGSEKRCTFPRPKPHAPLSHAPCPCGGGP
jgi:hypothetical protein